MSTLNSREIWMSGEAGRSVGAGVKSIGAISADDGNGAISLGAVNMSTHRPPPPPMKAVSTSGLSNV